jgi:LmbE family N-acetylglucosaminyl deacetylase
MGPSSRVIIVCLLLWASSIAVCQVPLGQASIPPDWRFKADILLIVAHPDDETALGSFLAKAVFDEHRRVAIIYCNRGSGGGNNAGIEQGNAMGAIREIEARQATSAFGITDVWFLDGRDVPGQDVLQSLEIWHHGTILEEVMRLVRLTRPEVILTWLPHFVAGENHGDHQASGVIATEAFDMAGDPTVFPAQVTVPRERTDINNLMEGLTPWQPKKIYYFSDASHPVVAPGPPFDMAEVSPSKQKPYYELAAKLHVPHLTQGDVAEAALKAMKSGDYTEFRAWLGRFNLIFGKSVVPCSPAGDLFEGITAGPAPYARAHGYEPVAQKGRSIELGGPFAFYKDFWRAHGIEHVGPLVKPEIEVAGNGYLFFPVILRNDTAETIDVTLVPDVPKGWEVASGEGRFTLAAGQVLSVQTFFKMPPFASQPPQPVTWKAVAAGATIGSVTINVTLKEWTLPQ